MGTHMARHISRLTSYRGTPQVGEDLVKLVAETQQGGTGYEQSFTCKHFLKIQIMVTNACKVKINENSEIWIDPRFGLTLDYTDLVIHSFEFIDNPGATYAVIGY